MKILEGKGRPRSPTNEFWPQKTRVSVLSYGEKIAKNFNRLSSVHQRHRQTDRQATDVYGSAIAYSEREREFTSAKNHRTKQCGTPLFNNLAKIMLWLTLSNALLKSTNKVRTEPF